MVHRRNCSGIARGARWAFVLGLALVLSACEGGDGTEGAGDASPGADVAAPDDTVAPRDGVGADVVPREDVPAATSVGCGPSARTLDTDWYRTAVVYEVFVRSFQDSDGDGHGDLRGLIDRLDYLNDGDPATDTDLGVTALWLMPVTEAASYHGYDVTDYRAIEADYGTMGDFEDVVRLAEQRGMKVFVDLVLNHTSSQHPWFVDAAAGAGAEKRDWYVWADEDLGWRMPTGSGGAAWNRRGDSFYYAAFWSGMPDLNYANPAVRDEALAVSRFWLDKGAAGFRLDAVRFLIETGEGAGQRDTPETIAFWKQYRQSLAQTHPDAALVGEVWTDITRVVPYFGASDDKGLHTAFDFDLQVAIDADLRATNGQPNDVHEAVCNAIEDFPDFAQNGPFLSNHDMTRFATRVRDDVPSMKLGAALLLTLPGTPFLYYGEEIGLPNGGTPRDEHKRLPMRWTSEEDGGFTTGTPWEAPNYAADAPSVAAQTDDPDSLLSHYRKLIRLRRSRSALASGRTELVPPESLSTDTLLAYLRHDPVDVAEGTLLVVHNFAAEAVPAAAIDLEGLLLAPAAPTAGPLLWGDATATLDGLTVTLDEIPAKGTVILEL